MGCTPERERDATAGVGKTRQAIGNGNFDSKGAYNAVVRVNVDGRGNCSGTLVTPLHVVTANHCVTGTRRDGFDCIWAEGAKLGDLTVGATITFQICHEGGGGSDFCLEEPPIQSFHTFGVSGQLVVRQEENVDLCYQENAAKDVAIIRLDERVPLSLVQPRPPGIVGNPTFTLSPSCLAGHDPDDFVATAVGFGKTWSMAGAFPSGNAARERHYQESEGWFRESGVLRNEWLATSTYEGSLPGDSGGALFTSRLCGVLSRHVATTTPPGVASEAANLESSGNQALLQAHILDASETHFAGLCNADDPNPWSDATLADTDTGEVLFGGAERGDGMPDSCDPCPFESEPDLRGNFDRGDDLDQDGVPDRCDNCPPQICENRGLAASFCANPYPAQFGPQPDSDGDGVGDICDSCPTVPNWGANHQSSPYGKTDPNADDPDADYVGLACDTCASQPNSWRACHADGDCTLTRTDGTVIAGECLEEGVFGRCDDDEGRVCRPELGDKDCSDGVECVFSSAFPTMQWGRCNQVLDDVNGNGVGGPCDTCDAAPGATVQANSNQYAEKRVFAPALGDACDPVPVYSARATPELFETVTRFVAAAGVGLDPDASYTSPGPFDVDVGHRWTNCRIQGNDVPPEQCYFGHATLDPEVGFNPSGTEFSTWKHVLTSFAPIEAYGGALFQQPPADQIVTRTFDSVVRSDFLVHPFGENEVQRVGRLENLIWYHQMDIDAGRVMAFPDPNTGKPRTTGLLWSHGIQNATDFASGRDQHYFNDGKGIRDHFAYIETPLQQEPFSKVLVPAAVCDFGPCNLKWRGDHLAKINPVGIVSLTEKVPGAGPILPIAGGGLVGWFGPADVGDAIGSSLAALIGTPGAVFVTAVESGQRAAPGAASVQGMVAPLDWTAASELGQLVFSGGELRLGTRVRASTLAAAASTAAPQAPGDRTRPAWVFSARQTALYMVGGQTGQQPSGEIWRFDTVNERWRRLVRSGTPLSPRRVLAAGYDEQRSLLLFVDVGAKKPGKPSLARVVAFDTARRTGAVLLQVPRLGVHQHVDVTARGDGTWVLTAQLGKSKAWVAYRFRPRPADAKIDWLGLRVGGGTLFDQPVNESAGIVVPVLALKQQTPQVVVLTPESFKPNKAGCGAL